MPCKPARSITHLKEHNQPEERLTPKMMPVLSLVTLGVIAIITIILLIGSVYIINQSRGSFWITCGWAFITYLIAYYVLKFIENYARDIISQIQA